MTHRSAEEKGDRDRVQEEKPGEKRERQRKSEITHYAKSAGDLPEIDQAGRIGAKPVCLFFFITLSISNSPNLSQTHSSLLPHTLRTRAACIHVTCTYMLRNVCVSTYVSLYA